MTLVVQIENKIALVIVFGMIIKIFVKENLIAQKSLIHYNVKLIVFSTKNIAVQIKFKINANNYHLKNAF